MKSCRFFIVLSVSILLFSVSATAAPRPSSLIPGPKDRCPVCGMFVAPYPNWVAVIEFQDGSREFFDGPKDMFIFLFDLGKYRPQSRPAEITGIHVTEYYTTRVLSAREVFFVIGSDVRGPMGSELVPVQGRDNAEAFKRDHGGTKIMIFNGEKLTELNSTK